jgi:hypothetical protein
MRTLTEAESTLINTTEYTVDWSDQIDTDDTLSGEQWDYERELEHRFEVLVAEKWDSRDDLGGLTVFFKDDKLVAFYDYEQYVGTVF